MENQKLDEAHKHSINNKEEIEKSESCGCFYCKKIFKSSEVKEWIKDKNGDTAKCPHCLTDSVIGDASGYALTDEFLTQMNKKWF